ASTARALSAPERTSPQITARRLSCRRNRSDRRYGVRSRTATRAPSSRKRSTMARPRPEAPPVMSATSPSSAATAWTSRSEQRAQIGRPDQRLVEKDMSARDLEALAASAQHILSTAEPAVDLGVQAAAIKMEADVERNLIAHLL